jgi:hypothetical protein
MKKGIEILAILVLDGAAIYRFYLLAPILGVLAGLVSSMLISFGVLYVITEKNFEKQIDESGEITSAGWDLRFTDRELFETCWEFRNPGSNDGIKRWKPGMNLEKANSLVTSERKR